MQVILVPAPDVSERYLLETRQKNEKNVKKLRFHNVPKKRNTSTGCDVIPCYSI